MKYANVIVDISHEKVDRIFQYRVPEALEERLEVGMQAEVPFGAGNRLRKACVVGFAASPDYPPEKIKEIHGIVEGSVKAEEQLIALAAWMRETCGSTMNQALKTVLPVRQRTRQKLSRTLTCNLSEEEGRKLLKEYERKHWQAKARLLDALLRYGPLDQQRALRELNLSAAVIHGLERENVLRVETKTLYRNPFEGHFTQKKREMLLNREQTAAVEEIWKDYAEGIRKTYLLHGVTGSGKTEVYMELIARVIREGKQAIVLIPEIALTFQTVMRFYERFGERVSVMHSRLSDGERYDQYQRAENGEIDVMIGPRSALFAPFSRIGFIIMDEEHEGSYKSETVPRYHARDAARFRAKLCGASVILGSATPSVDSYDRARSGQYGLCRLSGRFGDAKLPRVCIVDLRRSEEHTSELQSQR